MKPRQAHAPRGSAGRSQGLRILVVKRDKIGDMLLTTPLLAHLRECLPGARIDVLANDYNAWVVDDDPAIDRLWIYRRARHRGRLRWSAMFEQIGQQFALRNMAYDFAIAANGDPSPRALTRALAARAARTIAYVGTPGPREAGLTDPLTPTAGEHEIERLIALARPLHIGPQKAPAVPRFTVPDAWSLRARDWLAASGFTAGRFVVLGIGSRYPETQPQREQVLRWAAWAKARLDCDTAIHYTPGRSGNLEYPGSESLAHELRVAGLRHVRLMPTDIRVAIAIIALSAGNILPDGGLMHFAAISPGGVVGLFAERGTGSSPQRWGPRGARVAVVNAAREVGEIDDAEVLEPLARLHESRPTPSA